MAVLASVGRHLTGANAGSAGHRDGEHPRGPEAPGGGLRRPQQRRGLLLRRRRRRLAGLLDVALGCFLPALWACENLNGLRLLDDDATPLLRAWSARLAATPAAMAVMPETEEVVAFTRFLQTKFGVAGSK